MSFFFFFSVNMLFLGELYLYIYIYIIFLSFELAQCPLSESPSEGKDACQLAGAMKTDTGATRVYYF